MTDVRPTDNTPAPQPASVLEQAAHTLALTQPALLATICDHATLALFMLDAEGHCLYMNSAAERLTGFTLGALAGRTLHSVLHHAHSDEAPLAQAGGWLVDAPSGHGAPQGESLFRHAEGHLYPVTYKTSIVRDAMGQVTGAVLEVRDLASSEREPGQRPSARTRMTAALQAGEVGTFVWEVIEDRVYGDRNVEALFGIRMTDGQAPLAEFIAAIHPDDRARTSALIQQTLDTGCDYRSEYRIITQGRERHVSARGRTERDASGRVVRFSGVMLDITERKLAERAERELTDRFARQTRMFEGIASTTPDFIYIFDLQGRFLYANKRLLEVWGKSFDEAVGKELHELGYPDWHAQMHLREIADVIRTKQPIRGEVPFTGGSGISGVYEYIFTPVLGSDGEVEIIAGTTRDVTQRKQMEEAERRARADAEQASLLKDEFLATLSHELRTPLNAILGWSTILRRRSKGDEKISEGFAIIERNARVQVQLIEDLLDMSRIIAGKLRLDVQRVHLRDVITAALESVMPAAEAKNVRVQLVLDSHASPVRGDLARLQQVVWNLLSNAIKFTPKGGKVVVALERVNSHIEITVSDSGAGIEPEFLPHVFERFRQSDGGATRRHQGLGLGLGIVKSLVEMHGGQVRAKSAGPGQGATFSIELPVMVVHDTDTADREHPSAQSNEDTKLIEGLLEGVRVLVVDDEEDARELVRQLVEDAGGRVITASSAEQAFAMLQRERPHVLLSDVGMPEEDGYSLIRRVRELSTREGGDTPAVALTAFARSHDRRRALIAGFQAHIAKPVEPSELVTVVASVAGVMQRMSQNPRPIA